MEQFYKARRDKMVAAADKHLAGLCEYSVPLGGMFLWMKVPRLTSTWDMIMERGLRNNIMLMPGKVSKVLAIIDTRYTPHLTSFSILTAIFNKDYNLWYFLVLPTRFRKKNPENQPLLGRYIQRFKVKPENKNMLWDTNYKFNRTVQYSSLDTDTLYSLFIIQ